MPTRRNTEAALVVLAVLVLLVLEAAVALKLTGTVPKASFVLVGVIAAVLVAGHLVVRFFATYADPVLLPCMGLLSGIGVLFIRRLDLTATHLVNAETGEPIGPEENIDGIEVARAAIYPTEADRATVGLFDGDGGKQLLFMLIAVVVFAVMMWRISDHKSLARYPYLLGLMALLLLASPMIPGLGRSVHDEANLWISIGPLSMQPSEFAKLLLLIFFSYYLVRKREVLSLAGPKFLGIVFPRGRDLIPVLVVWGVSLLILLGIKDLGTSLLFFGMFVAMLYISTERVSWLLIGLVMTALAAVAMYSIDSNLQDRVQVWLNPFGDGMSPEDKQEWILGPARQLVQSLNALGSGGLFGLGPGQGHPELVGFAINSDFIFVAIGEELGLFGLGGIMALYILLISRGIRAGLTVRDHFGKLLAGGAAFSVGFQVFVVLGGVTALIPLTGQTAPFLASGGSSLLANWLLVGMLIKVSDSARRPRLAAGPIKVAPPPPPPVPVDNSPTQLVQVATRNSDEPAEPGTRTDDQVFSSAADEEPPSQYGPEVKP